jgi:ATP-binding cassette subfamily B (MDR/TAP) protein 1
MQAGNIFSFVPDITSARGAGAAIIKLIDSTPEIDAESTAGKAIEGDNVRGQIRFEDVYFRYPTRPGFRVLRGLSFKVEPGTYVALVGASGCGKSTVYVPLRSLLDDFSDYSCSIQMIERFYDPLSGQILLDGNPISELNVQQYRKQIALVSQEPVSTMYQYVCHDDLRLFSLDSVCWHCPFQHLTWRNQTRIRGHAGRN